MKNFAVWLTMVVSFFYSSASYSRHFSLDFSSKYSYEQSIQNIRHRLGQEHGAELFSEIYLNSGSYKTYRLPPRSIADYKEAHYVEVTGLNISNANRLLFIMSPLDIYILGWVVEDKRGRFHQVRLKEQDGGGTEFDISAYRYAGDNSVMVRVNGHYATLTGIAKTQRERIPIDSWNIEKYFSELAEPNNLRLSLSQQKINQSQATSLLVAATIISEALRFNQISKKVANSLNGGTTYNSYRMSSSDTKTTNDWGAATKSFHEFLKKYNSKAASQRGYISPRLRGYTRHLAIIKHVETNDSYY